MLVGNAQSSVPLSLPLLLVVVLMLRCLLTMAALFAASAEVSLQRYRLGPSAASGHAPGLETKLPKQRHIGFALPMKPAELLPHLQAVMYGTARNKSRLRLTVEISRRGLKRGRTVS